MTKTKQTKGVEAQTSAPVAKKVATKGKVTAKAVKTKELNTPQEAQNDTPEQVIVPVEPIQPEAISVDLESKPEAQNKETTEVDGIVVESPLELRPRDLPFIVKPKSGSWKNEAQAEYAGFLNGYAYKNPEKWEVKKEVLLKKLVKIGDNPKLVNLYKGAPEGGDAEKLTYTNNLLSN